MRLFGEITKVEALDDGTIKVIGVASTGAVDDADETVLPAAMKAALPAYMRFGALREMHGMSAAGATLSAQVDDDGVTRIETHVVDPLAVKKVQLGVYKAVNTAIADGKAAITVGADWADTAIAGGLSQFAAEIAPLVTKYADQLAGQGGAPLSAAAITVVQALGQVGVAAVQHEVASIVAGGLSPTVVAQAA